MRAPFSDWAVEDRMDFIAQSVLAVISGLVALLALVGVALGNWAHVLTFGMMLTIGTMCAAEAVRIRNKYEYHNNPNF